jgi:hypothetical protein
MKFHEKLLILLIFFGIAMIFSFNFETKKLSFVSKFMAKEKEKCGQLPQKENIIVDNIIWQVFQIPKGIYKLMNAYLDTREHVMVVRVAMMGDTLNIKTDAIFCQFWFEELTETQPSVVRATHFFMMWPECELCYKLSTDLDRTLSFNN